MEGWMMGSTVTSLCDETSNVPRDVRDVYDVAWDIVIILRRND
jgi:hypothetical protein